MRIGGGLAGAKSAYADQIVYTFVPDATQRLNGLRTGQWEWVQNINAEDLETAAADPNVSVSPSSLGVVNTFNINLTDGSVFHSLKARQALSLLVDKEAYAEATFGPEEYWAPLTPAIQSRYNKPLFSTVGEDVFLDTDKDQARELFREAGVEEGDTIRILTTKTYPQFYQWSVLLQGELASIGIEAELQVYDFATVLEKLFETDTWDLSPTFFAGGVTALNQVQFVETGLPWLWDSAEVRDVLAQYEAATSPEEASAAVDALQELVYRDIPVLQIGTSYLAAVHSRDLIVADDGWSPIALWNAALNDPGRR